MIKFLDWDTDFFGVKCGKAILEEPLSDSEWEEFLLEQKDYDFVSIVNKGCDTSNAVRISADTTAFLADTNVQLSKPVEDVECPDEVVVQEALPYNEDFLKLTVFEHSKFFHDKKLFARGGAKVYEQWLKNSFGKEGKFFAYVANLGYCLFSADGKNCVIELIRVSDKARGKGIGKKLLKATEHFAHSKGLATLSVGTQLTNTGALNFYISCGQKIVRADSTYHLWNI